MRQYVYVGTGECVSICTLVLVNPPHLGAGVPEMQLQPAHAEADPGSRPQQMLPRDEAFRELGAERGGESRGLRCKTAGSSLARSVCVCGCVCSDYV
jgi:hypothetical protein